MKLEYFKIIKNPSFTSKSKAMVSDQVYCFFVDMNSNKFQIKEAFQFLFSTKVESVNIKILPKKKKRVGKNVGYIKKRKLAHIKLAKGYKLNLFNDENPQDKAGKSKYDLIREKLFDITKNKKISDLAKKLNTNTINKTKDSKNTSKLNKNTKNK